MTGCGCFDPIAFGHTMCDRRPPHMVSEQSAQRHYEADVARRSQWAQMAYAASAAVRRGAETGAAR